MRRSDRAHTARITCACHLDWQVAERCDHDVVKAIAQHQELDAVYTLNYTSLFSEFFEYLRLIGLWEPLEALMPEHKEPWMIPALPLVLVYLQQHIAGLPSINAVEEVLLTDQTAMRIAGFNAHQIADGICRRGRHRRRAAHPPGRPVCADTLARNVCTIDPAAFTELFNTAVRCLAAQRVFPARVTVALDPTDIETDLPEKRQPLSARKVLLFSNLHDSAADASLCAHAARLAPAASVVSPPLSPATASRLRAAPGSSNPPSSRSRSLP